MTKKELLKMIEELQVRVACLEARLPLQIITTPQIIPQSPYPIYPGVWYCSTTTGDRVLGEAK